MRAGMLRTLSILVLAVAAGAPALNPGAAAAAPALTASAAAAGPAATRAEYTSLVVQHSGLCVAAGADDDRDGTAAVVQRPCRPADTGTDKFRLGDAPDGTANYFQLQSRHASGCLTAQPGKGAPVVERVCGDGPDQQFTFDQVDAGDNGPVMRLRSRQSGLCLGLAEKSKVVEQAIVQDDCVDGAPERLFIVTTTAAVVDGPLPWRVVSSGHCLDQDHTDGVARTRVIAFSCHGAANQLWYREQMGEHTIRLINASSGACLDQDYTGNEPNPEIIAYACHGGPNQLWSGHPAGDGSVQLRNVASGHCADQDYANGPGQRVHAFGCHGGGNQSWFGRPGFTDDGRLYREPNGGISLIVGGSPVGFWSMEEISATGYGLQWADVPAGWFGTQPHRPRDRTLIRGVGEAAVYVIVGGAKVAFASWEEVAAGGYSPSAVISVPLRYSNGLASTPADGTLVRAAEDGTVYVIAGGAKLAFGTWDEAVQAGHRRHWAVNLPKRYLDHLGRMPADGTLLRTAGSPQVWRVSDGERTAVTPGPGATVTLVSEAALKGIPTA